MLLTVLYELSAIHEENQSSVDCEQEGNRSMSAVAHGEALSPSLARAIVERGSLGVRTIASSVNTADRLSFARSLVYHTVSAYWARARSAAGIDWTLRTLPPEVELASIPIEADELARTIGRAAGTLDVLDAGYMIGVIYTGMMPAEVRARLGAHYTPPALCRRLLDLATEAGVDWRTARVLDPACGGGAFLAPLARRMAASMDGAGPGTVLGSIQRRLRGYELDPFAAWMSQVFLDVTMAQLSADAGRRPKPLVQVCDTLQWTSESDQFDLVVGNPPYGRVKLSADLRLKFSRSLFGHANMYGVFTDVALRFAKPGGVIAYVTPTSFLSGEYFKALRGLLAREAPPVSIDFVEKRKGVFADVLQETLLATYRRGRKATSGKVHFIGRSANGSIEITAGGPFDLPECREQPWLIPRTEKQLGLVELASRMPHRLSDYGYSVSTGPLVWNRHKPSLREQPGTGRFPLVWAESVRSDGVFEFRARKRNHKPYFEPEEKEKWVVTDRPCVLLQRTTAKEQSRRLIAAELPRSFIEEHGGVVVENHLNMIRSRESSPTVSPTVLAALLNSDVVDQVFRCINGSVAVSAYELQALPLPSPQAVGEVERLLQPGARRATVERAVQRLYGDETA